MGIEEKLATIRRVRDIVLSIHENVSADCKDSKLQAVHKSVGNLLNQLETGKCRAAIFGMRKSGKTTVLNSLLGDEFIPASVFQVLSSNIGIVHNTSATNGELFGENSVEEMHLLATGKQNISDCLKQSGFQFRKLFLHLPLPFLTRMGINENQLNLELIDYSAANDETEISAMTAETVVKQSCVIILVVDFRIITELESFVQHLLPFRYLLSRSLFIVNFYDTFYSPDYQGSLKPEDIPNQVSKELKKWGIKVQPDHVIPFSAKWALKARQWVNASVLINHQKGELLYADAILMLRQAGKERDAHSLEDEMTTENIGHIVSLLETFSQIERFENALLNMLPIFYDHKSRVKSAEMHDIVHVIEETLKAVKTVIRRDQEAVDNGIEYFDSWRSLNHALNVTITSHLEKLDNLQHHIFEAAFQKVNSSQFAGKLRHVLRRLMKKNLQESSESETCSFRERIHVVSQIRSTKELILVQARNTLEAEWIAVSSIFKLTTSSAVKRNIRDLKLNFLTTLSNEVSDSVDLGSLVTELSSYLSSLFEDLRESCVCLFPKPQRFESKKYTFRNDDLYEKLIQTHEVEICRPVNVEKCYEPDDCVGEPTKTCTRSEPHFSPDSSRLEDTFIDSFDDWIIMFQEEIRKCYEGLSQSLVSTLKDKLVGIVTETMQRVDKPLKRREDIQSRYSENIVFLRNRVSELKTMKRKFAAYMLFD